MKFVITLCGCDDESAVVMDVSAEELQFLRRLQEKVDNVSTYRCMPTLSLREAKEDEPES